MPTVAPYYRNTSDTQKAKTAMNQKVVDDWVGRFLKPSQEYPGCWEQADNDAARKKVSMIFRSLRHREKVQGVQQRRRLQVRLDHDTLSPEGNILSCWDDASSTSASDTGTGSLQWTDL